MAANVGVGDARGRPDRFPRRAVRSAVATPFRCALVTGLLLSAVAVGRWQSGGHQWTYFAVVGSELTDSTRLPFSAPVVPGPGYDGQYFLRLSLDPWPEHQEANGMMLDNPAYRHQRIGLPALAWGLSLGRPELAPAALVFLNVLALALGVGICGALANELGLPPALGLGLLGISGLLLAFGRDLAEPLTVLFLSVAALSLARGGVLVPSLALTAAVLTREDALLAVGALAAAFALRRRRDRPPPHTGVLLAVLLPSVSFVAWQAVLSAHWGRVPIFASTERLTLPLAGLARTWPVLRDQPLTETLIYLLYLLWHVALAAEIGRGLVRRDRTGGPHGLIALWAGVAWLSWGVLALFLTTPVWGDEWALARVLAQWSFFGFLLFLLGRWAPSRVLIALTLLLGMGSAGRLLVRP